MRPSRFHHRVTQCLTRSFIIIMFMFNAEGSNALLNGEHWTQPITRRAPPVGVWITQHTHHLRVITYPDDTPSDPHSFGSVTVWGDAPVNDYPQEHPYYMMVRWLRNFNPPRGSRTIKASELQTVEEVAMTTVDRCFRNKHSWNCWRLKADNPQVVELALDYARTQIATFTTSQFLQEEFWKYDWQEIMGRAAYAGGDDLFLPATHYQGRKAPDDYWVRSLSDVASLPPLADIPSPQHRIWISAEARVLGLSLKGAAMKTKVIHLDGEALNYQRDNLKVVEGEWLSIRCVSYPSRSMHLYRVTIKNRQRKEFSGADDEKRAAARLKAYRFARTLDEREGRTDIGHVMVYPYNQAEMASLHTVKRKSPSE